MLKTSVNTKASVTVGKPLSGNGIPGTSSSLSTSTLTGRSSMAPSLTSLSTNEWVKREIEQWGFDYIEYLFALGYEPTLTALGWRWVLTPVAHTELKSA